MSPERIVQLIAPGPLAGAERLVIAGTAALERAGSHVTLVVLVDDRGPENGHAFVAAARRAGITRIRELPCRGRADLKTMARLRWLLSDGPTVLHVHGYKTLTFGLLARPRRLPLVVTHHGNTALDSRVRFYEALATRLYRRVDAVVAVSSAVESELRQAGVPAHKVHTIINCLSLSEPPPAAFEVHDTLLALGRVSPEKGLDVLLDALRDPRLESVRVRVAGDGPSRAALERQSAESGLTDRVTWLGFVDDVRAELAAAGAVVMPSHREGLPMTAIEAASWGKPLIASRVGGLPEVVDHEETGLLVRAGDPRALADAIARWHSDPAAWAGRAAAASASIRARYSPSAWATATRVLYDGFGVRSGRREAAS